MNEKWLDSVIKDDPVVGSNTRGTISYATDGPDTRTSQVTTLNRPMHCIVWGREVVMRGMTFRLGSIFQKY